MISATKLPAFAGNRLGPVKGTVSIIPELYGKGKMKVSFKRRGASNAVVGEVWLTETQRATVTAPQLTPD